jgi:hypothetical protein
MKLKKCLSFINTKTNGKMTVLRALLVLIVMLLTSATAWADITTGTFADLAQEINIALSTGNYVQLTKDVYTYAGSGSVIDISKSCTIDGNSATIDMTGSDISVFKISAGITIKNLTIKNASNTAIVVDGNNCTVENCTFIDNNATNSSVIYVNGTDCTITSATARPS